MRLMLNDTVCNALKSSHWLAALFEISDTQRVQKPAGMYLLPCFDLLFTAIVLYRHRRRRP